MKLQYNIVSENNLSAYISELRLIEKDITYPLEDGLDSFFIDHGEDYSPFFTQQGFKTRFLIILDNDKVVGGVVGVWKRIIVKQKEYNALYASDLKLKKEYRNKGVVKNLLWYLFIRWPFKKDFKGWDFIYFCAMQRLGRGVDATFTGGHLGRLTKHQSLLNIYILKSQELKQLDFKKLCYEPKDEINLSPNLKNDIMWNEGKKNIVTTKEKSLLKLGHINPELFYLENIDRLNIAINTILEKKGAQLCFAVDNRNKFVINQLEKQGIDTQTKCKVFSFSPFLNPFNYSDIVSLSTGEI